MAAEGRQARKEWVVHGLIKTVCVAAKNWRKSKLNRFPINQIGVVRSLKIIFCWTVLPNCIALIFLSCILAAYGVGINGLVQMYPPAAARMVRVLLDKASYTSSYTMHTRVHLYSYTGFLGPSGSEVPIAALVALFSPDAGGDYCIRTCFFF